MPGAHEKLERAEYAAHEGNHHGGHNKLFGVTMALIGVLIALSGAMVGSERNELTRTMIEQTQAHATFTSASTKFRLIMDRAGEATRQSGGVEGRAWRMVPSRKVYRARLGLYEGTQPGQELGG